MIKFTLFLVLLLSGCAIKAPINDWQVKSTTAFNSYQKNFLNNNDAIAKSDLSRAIRHAKQSANLTQLAKVYLGSCALNISSGINDECTQYQNIADVSTNSKLEAYYSFLSLSLKEKQITLLPPQYQGFAKAMIQKDFSQANKEILKMKKASSTYLSASLMKNTLTKQTRQSIIKMASSYGHKKIILFCLKEVKKSSTNSQEIADIDKKISILSSPL